MTWHDVNQNLMHNMSFYASKNSIQIMTAYTDGPDADDIYGMTPAHYVIKHYALDNGKVLTMFLD